MEISSRIKIVGSHDYIVSLLMTFVQKVKVPFSNLCSPNLLPISMDADVFYVSFGETCEYFS